MIATKYTFKLFKKPTYIQICTVVVRIGCNGCKNKSVLFILLIFHLKNELNSNLLLK